MSEFSILLVGFTVTLVIVCAADIAYSTCSTK